MSFAHTLASMTIIGILATAQVQLTLHAADAVHSARSWLLYATAGNLAIQSLLPETLGFDARDDRFDMAAFADKELASLLGALSYPFGYDVETRGDDDLWPIGLCVSLAGPRGRVTLLHLPFGVSAGVAPELRIDTKGGGR